MERLAQTVEWLYSLEARGEIYKLERMERALERIGNPHLRLQVAQIAGTKGKLYHDPAFAVAESLYVTESHRAAQPIENLQQPRPMTFLQEPIPGISVPGIGGNRNQATPPFIRDYLSHASDWRLLLPKNSPCLLFGNSSRCSKLHRPQGKGGWVYARYARSLALSGGSRIPSAGIRKGDHDGH